MKIKLAIVSILLVFSCKDISKTQVLNNQSENWAFQSFEKVDSINPILKPTPELVFIDPITENSVKWEERNVLNPTAVVKDNKVYLMYRAQDSLGTSRIGMAVSDDGLHFEKLPEPSLI